MRPRRVRTYQSRQEISAKRLSIVAELCAVVRRRDADIAIVAIVAPAAPFVAASVELA
jgi:hypothetical protein